MFLDRKEIGLREMSTDNPGGGWGRDQAHYSLGPIFDAESQSVELPFGSGLPIFVSVAEDEEEVWHQQLIDPQHLPW